MSVSPAPEARSSVTISRHPARRQRPYLLALTPAAILISLFFLFPALWAIYVSTTSLSLTDVGAGSATFSGLDNYRRLWNNPDFPKFVKNTIVFVLGAAVVGETVGGFGVAILLSNAHKQGYRLSSLAFAAVVVAGICPPALTGAIWGGIFDYRNGVLNEALTTLHLGRIDMLGGHPMLAVIIAESWRGLAFAMIIFYAALHTIPAYVYEAARVDGGSKWSQFAEITFPAMRHVFVLVLMMTTIMTIGSFLSILVMTNGDPAYQTETLALNAYHTAFQFFDIGYGAALTVALLLFVIAFSLVYGSILVHKR